MWYYQFEQLQQKLIYKHATRTQGVFYTRQDVWNVTYEKAKEGGWFGGGYGISIGDKSKFQFGLTAEKYGREKGNAQLAIIEETGIIGFVLYAASLFFLFARLINAVRRWPSGPEKVVIAITTSTVIGMIVGSCFEAWWVAPGAPESVYFWVITGVALGYSSTRPLSDHELAKPVISRRLVDVQNHGHAPTVG